MEKQGRIFRTGSVGWLALVMALMLALPGGLAPVLAQGGLTLDRLRNATYTLNGAGTVALVDGIYQYQYGQGASEVDTVGFQRAAFGDLDADGAEDAAVVLWHDSGGSGTFIHLAAVHHDGGSPVQAALTFLGDRTYVYDLTIQAGQIVVRAVVHADTDPLCCPSLAVESVYALAGDALTLVSETGLGQMVNAGGDVSFVLPYALAPAVTATREAETAERSAHARVDFPQYLPDAPVSGEAPPRLLLFETTAFAAEAGGALAALQGLLGSRPALDAQEMLPALPLLGDVPTSYAQAAYLDFAGGAGIRYLSAGTDGALFYMFQGLTEDGRYYVALSLPLEGGTTLDTPVAAVSPPLATLDTLAQTLFVSPLALQ